MRKFYISDTHFGHKGIIKHAHRPFKNVSEMDETLIRNWNTVIPKKSEDIIYHLGDFCWGDDDVLYYLKQLNGLICFSPGNHDSKRTCSSTNWFDKNIYRRITDGPYNIVLFHYPILDWDRRFHGSYHFYGHVHGNLEDLKNYPELRDILVGKNAFAEKENRQENYPLRDFFDRAFDIGVECLDYYPRTAEEIITRNFTKYE